MNWHKQLEESLDYIEANLTGEIDLRHLGRITHCSAYHFQRIFSFVVGVPLAEYVRRRKMTMAAAELAAGAKVIDVALRYGYESPNSFAAAFKRVHGIVPSKAAHAGSVLKSYPRLRLHIAVTGESEMEYRIEEKSGFRVVGIGHDLSRDVEQSFDEIPHLWEQVGSNGALEELFGLANQEPMGLMGITTGFDGSASGTEIKSDGKRSVVANGANNCCSDECLASINSTLASGKLSDSASELGNYTWCSPRYYIAVASDMDVPEGFEEYHVPPLTWVVFEGRGEINEQSNAVRGLAKRVLVEWLPSSGFELANGPDIELFSNPDPTKVEFEMWLPIVKT